MNNHHLQQIIDHYITRFEELNAPGNEEYYKWQIIQRFRPAMDEALAAIKQNEALMATDASRYEIDSDNMHPDTEKHILLFDLMREY